MRTEIITRQRNVMLKNGLDALVAISPENFAYTVGFVVPSQPLMRWRHAMAVVTANGETVLVIVDMEETTVRERAPGTRFRVWGEFTDNPMQTLGDLLKELGLASSKIGIEFDYLPAGDFEDLKRRLPKALFLPAQGLYSQLRQLKTAQELELLRRLSHIADGAIGDAFRSVRSGMTEMDLAAALTRNVYALGAEQFKLMIIATGERSQLPNVGPTDRMLELGDVCRVEVFCVINGYHAGVCRTAVVQRAHRKVQQIYQNLAECKFLILDMIRPGASTREIYDEFIKKFGELGLPAISFVGHGIGLHLHEEPYLGKYSNSKLKAGMVLSIEPLVYRTNMGFGMQIKDMVTVTDKGCELLSDRTDTDNLFVIS